jgi:hypothetical protein
MVILGDFDLALTELRKQAAEHAGSAGGF